MASGDSQQRLNAWVANANNPSISRNRYQVLETYPLLVPEIARGIRSQAVEVISAAIDHGYPLIAAVTSSLKVRKETTRFLRGKQLSLVGTRWAANPLLLFQLVDNLPRHRWPLSAEDWTSFNRFWEGCNRATRTVGLRDKRKALRWHIFRGLCSMGYRQAEKRLAWYWPEAVRWTEILFFVECLEMWSWHQAVQLGFNAYIANVAEGQIASELLMRYPAIKIHELAKRWHHVYTFSALNKLDRVIPPWPPLLPTPVKVGNLSVVSLVTRSELLVETTLLKHCVWQYTQRCVRGKSHIVSIQNAQGVSLSTAEIQLQSGYEDFPTPVLIQHRSEHNGEPTSDCWNALATVLMQLADSESPNWVGRIAADLQKWQREIDARLGECREFSVYEGICACLEDTLPDYGQALEWLSCRLENEEGLYRHRNDQAEETLMWVGLGTENSERRLDELGYFDPAVFDALEEYEMVFKGRNYPNEPWAARWTGVPFWFFKHVSRE